MKHCGAPSCACHRDNNSSGWRLGTPQQVQHGTRSRYHAGCRCTDCRDAERVYRRQLRASDATARSRAVKLAVAFQRAEWMADAACRGLDPELFFPVSKSKFACDEALAVCATCPVTQECLVHAKRTGETAGVWGGLTPRQRKRVRVA